ncbi:MAG: chitobiase/beta-hexosaminidase C-terminal domain-containing protein [Butyrivibrio sp.]|nr:chitobiase/beta-hexosaminidase C-terminal domain-containing protein [Butyrivibrio sp.]
MAGMLFATGTDISFAADYSATGLSGGQEGLNKNTEETDDSEKESSKPSEGSSDEESDEPGEGTGKPAEEDEETSSDPEKGKGDSAGKETSNDEDDDEGDEGDEGDEAASEESDEEASLDASEDEALAGASAEKKSPVDDIEFPAGSIPAAHSIEIVHNEPDEILVGGNTYDSRHITENLPDLKYQGSYGTCWAFATTAIEEISLMKNSEISDPDLSEFHTAYFTYNNNINDPLGGTEGDYQHVDIATVLPRGGNVGEALENHSRWMGIADESTAPYDTTFIENAKENGLSDDLAYDDVAHVRNYYLEYVNMAKFRETKDLSLLEPIKKLVYENGAAAMSYDSEQYNAALQKDILSTDGKSYYNPGTSDGGHAVVIVGWDDDYPKENFAKTPPGNGAFRVRNSWYTQEHYQYGRRPDTYYGYFWMSYYENTLDPHFYGVDCQASSNYDNNYEYDGYRDSYYLSNTGANVFTAHADGGTYGEALKAVSFFTNNTNVEYTIEVYTDVDDTPDSGILQEDATTTGFVELAGSHTIDLDAPVYLESGEKFAVVVKLDCSGLVCESLFDNGTSGNAARSGESFYLSGKNWVDCVSGTQGRGNFKIKAYTDNRSASDLVSPTEISFANVEGDDLELGISQVFKVDAKVLPVNSNIRTINWSSSNTSAVTVEKGKLTGIAAGSAVITASVPGTQIKKEINVTVKRKLFGLSISPQKLSGSGGFKYYYYEVSYQPSDYIPTEEIQWTSSDEDVVTVKTNTEGKALITEKMMGKAKITATVEGVSATDDYEVEPSWDFVDYEVTNDKVVTFKWKPAKGAVKYYLLDEGRSNVIAEIPEDGSSSYRYVDDRNKDSDLSSYTYYLGIGYDNSGNANVRGFSVHFGTNYTITYHVGRGTQNPKNPTTYLSGRKYITLYDPTPPDEYSFEGWYTDPTFEHYKYQITTYDTGDIDLYAKYVPENPRLTVTPESLYLAPGETGQITATAIPSDGTEVYTFTNYSPELCSVTQNKNVATVTAGSDTGSCTIYVSCYGQSQYVRVYVRQPIYFYTNEASYTTLPGDTYTLPSVVLASHLEGSTIDYTSSDPLIATVSDGELDPADDLSEEKQVTITAKIRGTDYSATCVVTLTPAAKAMAPLGRINYGENVEPGNIEIEKGSSFDLRSLTYGASIYYTLDGTDPAIDSHGNITNTETTFLCDHNFIIQKDMVIKAVAYHWSYAPSDVSTFNIKALERQLEKAPAPYGVFGGMMVMPGVIQIDRGDMFYLTSDLYPATIYYAYDEKVPSLDEEGNPTQDTLTYSGNSIYINEDTVIKAITCAEDYLPSDVSTFVFKMKKDDPDPEKEYIWFDSNVMTLRSKAGETGQITYHVDDQYKDTPIDWQSMDESVATVSNGIVTPADDLTETKLVTIMAYIRGTEYYAVCTVSVVPVIKAKAPVGFVNGEASDTNDIRVIKNSYFSLKSETEGASIYYALDGEEPSVDEDGNPQGDTKLYTKAFLVEDNMEIKALAYIEECDASDISSFELTIIDDEWGDLTEDTIKSEVFGNKSSNVGNKVWYFFGNPEKGYPAVVYTGSSEIQFSDGEGAYNVPVYTGSKITFNGDIHVFHGTRRLIEGRDYTVSYKNNLKAASAGAKAAPTVTIKGKGNYASTAIFKFDIEKAPMSAAQLTSETEVAVLTGKKVKLGNTKPVLKFAGKTLKAGTDYSLTYFLLDGDEKIPATATDLLTEAGKTYVIDITATEKSSFTGTVEKAVTIKTQNPATTVSAAKLKAVDAKGKAIKLSYTGADIDIEEVFDNDGEDKTPTAFVKYGKKTLVYGTDYTVEAVPGENYTSAGKHKLLIKGIPKEDAVQVSYLGNKTVTIEIVGISMSKVKVAGLRSTVEYTGKTITWDDLYNEKDKSVAAYNKLAGEGNECEGVTLYYYNAATKENVALKGIEEGQAVTEECDFTYSKIKSLNPGKFTIIFKGVNGVTGNIKKNVTIKPYNVKNNAKKRIVIEVEDAEFSKAGACPHVAVWFIKEWDEDGNATATVLLKEGIDYRVSYKNNKKVADKTAKSAPTVTVKGIGNYTGSNASEKFSITKAPISSADLVASDVAYKVKGKKGYFLSTPKVYQNGAALSVGKGKDLENFNKNLVEYTYAKNTYLLDEDGTLRYAGETVDATDAVPAGTLINIKVPANMLNCGAKSNFYQDYSDEYIKGSFRVMYSSMNIAKYKAEVRADSKLNLSFNNGDSIVLSEEDIKVYKVVNKQVVTLKPGDYEIEVTNKKFLGKTVIVIKGKGDYYGTKKISVKLGAKKITEK